MTSDRRFIKNFSDLFFISYHGNHSFTEGLEQMRFLHNRIPVKMIDVDYRNRKSMSGVDSPEDIERAEKIIAEFGEFNLSPE